jgi:hypothetical protein
MPAIARRTIARAADPSTAKLSQSADESHDISINVMILQTK